MWPWPKQRRSMQCKMYPGSWCIVFRCVVLALFCLVVLLSRSLAVLADAPLTYRVSIEGIADRQLETLLEAVSNTVALRKTPPASLKLLRKRVNQDIPRLIRALRSRAYYAAKVSPLIDETVKPIQVVFRIDSGPAYLLKVFRISVSGEAEALKDKVPKIHEIGLALEEPARSKSILDAEKAIVLWYRGRGFPYPKVTRPEVIVDHAAQAVSVTFHVQSGPSAAIGSTEIKGVASVREDFLRGKIPWKEGDRFDAGLLREARRRLIATGLFAIVQVKPGEIIDKEGRIPIIIEVKERKHRTIKAGASYRTAEGAGGRLSWEHRNFFGRGERLNLSATGTGIGFAINGGFRKPDFLRPEQSLLLNLWLADEFPIAYTSRNFNSVLQLERRLSKGMIAGAGLGFRFSDVEQLEQTETFRLFFLPLRFNWDTSDQPLDPGRGGRLNLQLAPYHDFFGGDLTFVKGLGSYSRYLGLLEKPSVSLALRGTLGSMAGAEAFEIPADIRFYAGGAGSIRGYAWQTVGPRLQNQPVGGRSLAELSVEFRMKVTETIGFVVFLDGGNAYESAFPDFEEPLRWGTGAGFRYFTKVGPLRLDVGVPIDRREGIDDAFQIYASLGQAF